MIPAVPCDPAEPCCVSLYEIAAHILAAVYDALTVCYPNPDVCAPLAAYVTLGLADDGIPDALTVSSTGIEPSASNLPGSFGLWRATFAVILRESGWPTAHVEGDTIMLPDPVLQASASQHVYSMGEAMHRALAYMMRTRTLVPSSVQCSKASVGQMVPLPPQGGVVGWQAPVTVDLGWN